MNRRRIVRYIVLSGALLLAITALLLGAKATAQSHARRQRAAWEAKALPGLAGLSLTNQQILTEIDQIRNPIPPSNFGWANEHVILMTNGEYLVYAWHHGANNGFVDHLFLAHGSDGGWYYSTYHFCNSMVGIQSDNPAGSIGEFAKRYSVRSFDGKSDECLNHTWP